MPGAEAGWRWWGHGKSKQNMQSLLGRESKADLILWLMGVTGAFSTKGETYLICLVGAHLACFVRDWIVGWKGEQGAAVWDLGEWTAKCLDQ